MYIKADVTNQLPSNSKYFQTNVEYRNLFITHLNQSFIISSPFGRLLSYINDFST